ncbi:ABC transporter ATP-binding protein YtrB [Lacticaseibacillus paracasei]|nr:ABC transporter ATP-binding protein YtrB [Lacticaseibacillus paracasei]
MSLTITKLQKKIADQAVLNNITFSLSLGQVVGLVGPNGIGKTTIFRTVTHQYRADGGTIELDEQDLTDHPEQRENLFYLDNQHLFFPQFSRQVQR